MKDASVRLCEGVHAVAPKASIYLFGSAAADDFFMGWSNVDFPVLTAMSLMLDQAEKLLPPRETLRGQSALPQSRASCAVSLKAYSSWNPTGERRRA